MCLLAYRKFPCVCNTRNAEIFQVHDHVQAYRTRVLSHIKELNKKEIRVRLWMSGHWLTEEIRKEEPLALLKAWAAAQGDRWKCEVRDRVATTHGAERATDHRADGEEPAVSIGEILDAQ
jgi:hypothetical protein